MVKNQNERGAAFSINLERCAELASVVGAHYFQLNDEPVTGRSDGENYNIGFINELDLPYREMVSSRRRPTAGSIRFTLEMPSPPCRWSRCAAGSPCGTKESDERR